MLRHIYFSPPTSGWDVEHAPLDLAALALPPASCSSIGLAPPAADMKADDDALLLEDTDVLRLGAEEKEEGAAAAAAVADPRGLASCRASSIKVRLASLSVSSLTRHGQKGREGGR